MQGLKIKWIISNMMRIMIACEIANKSENMENQKHRVFWENIVFFQVPAISWVLGSSGILKVGFINQLIPFGGPTL